VQKFISINYIEKNNGNVKLSTYQLIKPNTAWA